MKAKESWYLPYLLILPSFLFVLVFTLYPTFSSLAESLFLHRLNIPKYRTPQFYGLGNYIDLFKSADFREIMGNTLLYVIILVPASVTAAFFLALWLRKKQFSSLRIAVFYPTLLPAVSAATIWLFLLTPDYGLFNRLLNLFGYNGPENWVGNPGLALPSLILMAFWKDTGFYMIYFLAGLMSMPKDVFEALVLEGAKPLTVLFKFILPLLRRTTLFVTTVAVIGAFRMVDHVFIMTSGGPGNKSSLLLYHLWQMRFERLNLGQSAAITIILILLLLAFTISNFLFSERGGREND